MSKFLDFTGLSYLISKLKDKFLGISDTAESAKKLSTTCTINGVSFNGTSNITISDNTKLPLGGG